MTDIPAPPSYNEAILQRKLSELAIGEHNAAVNNAQMNDDIIELSPPSTDESIITKDKAEKKDSVFPNGQQAAQNNTRPITVGRVLLIGLLLFVSPWCACKMMKSTPQQNKNIQGCGRTRKSGCCGGNVNRMERQQQRGERRIARLERRIERKTEKMDRKEARDKLCNRKRQKYERKIHRWENKVEQRQNIINSTCKSNDVYSSQKMAVKC